MTTQPQITEAEWALQKWGIEYLKQKDGTLVVEGLFNISGKGLTKLPDLTKIIVKGNFYCHNNQLTSLIGAPTSVGGGFSCANNRLTSLAGAPASVGTDFSCYNNQLTSLAGAPTSVGGGFSCANNHLTSLAGAPAIIGDTFYCQDNQLTSLEYAPQKFRTLQSNFGHFTSWNEVPEDLRISPETREKKRQETLSRIGAASTQRQTFKPMPSIRFKAGPK